jgi:hypothetical protein
MKNFFKLSMMVVLLLTCQVVSAQDDMIREERKVSGFSAVNASGIANVYLQKGTQEKVTVEVNDKEFNDRLKVEVVDNVLVIRMEKTENRDNRDNRNNNIKLKVFVTYTSLKSLEGSGATNFYADDEIKADEFELKVSGANNSKLKLNTKKLDIETSGASNVTLTGAAEALSIRSSGASNVKAYDLKAGDVSAESSGVANIYVSAQDELEVKASGLSNVNYKGDAKVITKEVSKMANVKKH